MRVITTKLATPEIQQYIEVLPYSTSFHDDWNAIVAASSSGTFLHKREYMEYHSHRFDECSVMVRYKGDFIAVFPACRTNEDEINSYAGLTYGGLLWQYSLHSDIVLEILTAVAQYYAKTGAKSMIYKSVPHIYRIHPDEADLYWLWKQNAVLKHRQLSSAFRLNHQGNSALPYNNLRKRKMQKGQQAQLCFREAENHDEWADLWQHLAHELWTNHQKIVVHTLDEILLLKNRFPEHIHLYIAVEENAIDGDSVQAGMVIYETAQVIHSQYIMVSDKGRDNGALDFVTDQVFRLYSNKVAAEDGVCWFDFGISSEGDGTPLNRGLLFQKEGFGARSLCYDTYEINLETLVL